SSATRAASRSGSKVITDPVELGPDFCELLLQACALFGHRRMVAERLAGADAVISTRMTRTRKRRILRGVFLGWLAAYLFDPRLGRGRRAVARDWVLARGRRLLRRGERAQRYATATAYGKTQAFLHRHEAKKPQPDDATLAHKVETIIFRDADVPKGQININAEDGVV